jgi:hypothetical protein
MKASHFLIIIAIAVLAIITFPLAVIWALNTLFGFTIAYGFFEWLAAFILVAVFKETGLKFDIKK